MGLGELGVLAAGSGAQAGADPLLREELQGEEDLVVVHRPVADRGPAVGAPDDDFQGFRRRDEERALADVSAVGVELEDESVVGSDPLEAKGARPRI